MEEPIDLHNFQNDENQKDFKYYFKMLVYPVAFFMGFVTLLANIYLFKKLYAENDDKYDQIINLENEQAQKDQTIKEFSEKLAKNMSLNDLDPQKCDKILLAKIDELKKQNMKMKLKDQMFKKYKNEKVSQDEYKQKISKEQQFTHMKQFSIKCIELQATKV